ncbi:helix-turn-helix domain-containing protein [Nocardia fusca]|uniref:helix-turn-helix domain-containing protein n=1 Tax=Nocardia fusca TaxID=941183 RepID=UPI0037B7143D
MDDSWSLNPVVELRKSFEGLPAVLRHPIEMVVFGGELPRADISGMRRMAAEFRAQAAALRDHSEDANNLLAQENSTGALGDRLRETLGLHRDGAARLGDDALALADQVQAAANDAEKTLCVMFVFGIELAWRIFGVLSGAAAAGPAGEVAAVPVVESMLVEGRARVAAMRAGLEQAFRAGATRMAARLSALGSLPLPVTLGMAAALPVGVDAGVQALQILSGDRTLAVIGPAGENPTGLDLTSIEVAALSGVGGAAGGMVAGRVAPKVFPRIEGSRLALGLVHGTAGAVAGLGAATLVTGWPEHFDHVLAPLLNGGFAGAVHAHAAARPGSGAPAGAVTDGGGAFTRPDLPAAARSEKTATPTPALPPVEVSAESQQAWAAAKAAWAAAPDTVAAGGERAEVPAVGAHGNTAPVEAGGSRSPAASGSTPHNDATGRAPVGFDSAARSVGRPETGPQVAGPQRGEPVVRPNATAQRPVEAGGETSAPPKVATSTPARQVGTGPETPAAGEHRSSGNHEHGNTGKVSVAAAETRHETPVDARPATGTGDGPETPAAGEHRLPGNEEHAPAGNEEHAAGAERSVLAGETGDKVSAGPAADSVESAGSPALSARDQAVELLADFHAGSGDQVPEQLRLCNLPDEVLKAGLFDTDAQKSMIATTEIIRRGTISDAVPGGMVLRVEQAEGVYALDKRPVEMKPGEGKSLMFMAAAMQRAVRHGECLLVTTTDGLAHREFTRYRQLLTDFGIDVFRADQQQGFGPVTGGRPAVVVATGETVGHLCNAGHRPPRHALIDEMDGIIDRGERQFLRSEGVEHAAPEATAREVFAAHDFLADALEKGTLSHEDFGLTRIIEEVGLYPDGTPEVEFWYDGRAELTPGGREKVEALPGGKQWLEGLGLSRLETAAAAEFTCRKSTHYVMDAGKIVIIDQGEHGLQRNPKTSSESRWSAEQGQASLAQAVEAKEIRSAEAIRMSAEQHQIVVRADADSAKSINAVEIYRTGGRPQDRFFDEVTGASGTLADLNPVLEKIYGLEEAHQVDRSREQRLMEGAPEVVANTRAKLSAIAEGAHRVWQGGQGRSQEILCHRNDLVDRQVQALVRQGVPREAIEAVDADRIAGWGAGWEGELQKIFDAAGEQGKILVINRQGQRGVDISVAEAVQAKGGMFIWMTEVPEQSYIHEQAKNRTARNGDRGAAQALISPQDALIRKAMHLKDVRAAAVRYEQVAEAHRTDPTPVNHNNLVEAGHTLRSLVPELQERALRHATADFIRHHAYITDNPAAVLAAAETFRYQGSTDIGQIGQPDQSPDQAARLAGLLGIRASALAETAAALEQDGAVDPLGGLLEQTGLPPAAVEALRQHVEATAPATAAQYARLTDEQALDQLVPQRDRLAGELGWDTEAIEGAEGMRMIDPALTEARNNLAKALGYPASDITPAIARDILGEAVSHHLPTAGAHQPASRDDAAPVSVHPVSVNGVAENPVAEDVLAAASHYLATAALLDLVVQIHRRNPNSCVNNAVTGMRVLTARRFELLSNELAGHGRDVVEEVFGAALEDAGSLDKVAESLKARPGGIAVLVYKWKDTQDKGSAAADNHMVLLVNDSKPGERPALVVVDLAASRDGRTDTDYGPKDLRNRRTLLNKAVPFDTWRDEQQKFIDRLPPEQRRFETIDFDADGHVVARSHREAPAETRPPSQDVEVSAELVQEINSIQPGRPVNHDGIRELPSRTDADTPDKSDISRSAEPARTGSRPQDTPDPTEPAPETGQEPETLSATPEARYLLSPASRPLAAEVIGREIDEVTEILGSRVPPEQLADPEVRRGLRLVAEGLFINRRLYGGPDTGRTDDIHDAARHDATVELRKSGAANRHGDGTRAAEDLRRILDNGLLQGADLGEIMAAMVADAWSDLAGRGGRHGGNPRRQETVRSAELLHARALAHGCAASTARVLGFAVSGIGFDARTGTQTIASPAAVDALRQRWGVITVSEFGTAMRVARWVAAADLQTLSEPDAVVQWVLSDRGIDVAERPALIDRLRDRADFAHPDSGYRPPDGWLLANRDMRRDHAAKAREIADRLVLDPRYSPLDAYRDARLHAAEMREEYSGFRWQLVVGPGTDASDPGTLADAVATRLPESGPARAHEDLIDSVVRLVELALPRAGGDAVFVVTSSQDVDGRRRLLAQLDYTRPDATDPAPGVTAEELRREMSEVDGRIEVDTADPLPDGQVRHRVRLDLTRQRILVCCTYWGMSGTGMSTLNLALCQGLAEAGHDVSVWTGGIAQGSRIPGVKIYGRRDVAGPVERKLYDGYADDLPQSVDLVIVHAEDGGIRAALAAETRFPAAKLVSVHHLTPMLWDTLGHSPERGRAKVASHIYLARRAHLVTGLGPVLATDSLSAAVMAGHGSVHELQPGLEIAEQPPEPAPGDPAWILLFGRVDDQLKGAAETAEVVQRLRAQGRDVRLVVRGYPKRGVESARAALAELVGDPAAVEVRPYTSSRVQVRHDIRTATVVVMPSRAEGFGWVAAEAIEQGVPVAVPSSSGVGRFLAELADYRDLAERFNLVEQSLGAHVPIDNWVAGLGAVLDDLPGAWAAARGLQGLMRPYTRENSARMLVHAARNTHPHARPAIPPSRTRVSLVAGHVVARGEEEDYLRILAVAEAMESDRAVREAVISGTRIEFAPSPDPLTVGTESADDSGAGARSRTGDGERSDQPPPPGRNGAPDGLIGSRPGEGHPPVERVFAGPGFRKLVKAGLDSGVVECFMVEDAPGVLVESVTFGTGLQVFKETYADPIGALLQALNTRVAAIMRAPVAQATLILDDFTVYRELTPGQPVDSVDIVGPGILNSDSARRLGLFDAVTGTNRTARQWRVGPDNEVMGGRSQPDFDSPSVDMFAAIFVQRIDGREVWQDHAMPRMDLAVIREQVTYLESWASELRILDEERNILLGIVRGYEAALVQIEGHAVRTPGEILHGAGLDVEAQDKARLVEAFSLKYPHVTMRGFDHPDVRAHVVAEILGGLDEMLTRFPDRTNIRELRIDYLGEEYVSAATLYHRHPDAAGRTLRMHFGLGAVARPARAVELGIQAHELGWSPVGDRPFHHDAVHEFVHAIDAVEWLSKDLRQALSQTWEQLSESGLIEESEQTWLARLPGYAFHDEAKSDLNVEEALAVGFAEADIHGVAVGTPQWAIHEYVTTGRLPRVTPDLEVALLAHEGHPNSGGQGGLIGSRPGEEPGQQLDAARGAWIKTLRLEREMTQKQLAQAVGVTSSALSAFEYGKKKPRIGTFQKICRALGLEGEALTEAGRRFFPDVEVRTGVAAHDSLGGWVAALRNNKGMTRVDLARAVGMSPERITEIEDGERPRPGPFLRIARELGVGQQALAAATRKFYRDIEFDLDPAAHDPGLPGSWIAALRCDRGVSQAALARTAGIAADYVRRIEGGHTPTSIVFWRICRALGVAPEVLAAAARHFYRDLELDTDPAAHDPASPGSWIVALRHDRGMTQSEVAKTIESGSDLSHIESGRNRLGFAVFRRICEVLGVGDELLRAAARHFYPDIDLDIDPASHETLGRWIAALRHDHGMSAAELARRARMSQRSIYAIEHEPRLPRLRKLREICRALGVGGDVLLEAVDRFYAGGFERSGDRDEEDLFDRYVVSRVGSPEEREIRDEICARFAWVPNALARRQAPEIRDEAVQAAWMGILSAIDTHVPCTSFAAHAWAGGNEAILRYRVARGLPDLDSRTLRKVITVRAQIRRMISAGAALDDTEIARATRLKMADVVLAREILSRPTVHLDAPITGKDGSGNRQLADPAAPTGFSDTDYAVTVRAALADMPDPGTAERLVTLHLVEGEPLAGVAERLGLQAADAAEVLADSIARLRDAFGSDRPGEVSASEQSPAALAPGAEVAERDQLPVRTSDPEAGDSGPRGLIGSRPLEDSPGKRAFAGPGLEELVPTGPESGIAGRFSRSSDSEPGQGSPTPDGSIGSRPHEPGEIPQSLTPAGTTPWSREVIDEPLPDRPFGDQPSHMIPELPADNTLGPVPFTAYETEVLARVRQGMTYNEIAAALDLSVRDVRAHLASVRRKLRNQRARLLAASRPADLLSTTSESDRFRAAMYAALTSATQPDPRELLAAASPEQMERAVQGLSTAHRGALHRVRAGTNTPMVRSMALIAARRWVSALAAVYDRSRAVLATALATASPADLHTALDQLTDAERQLLVNRFSPATSPATFEPDNSVRALRADDIVRHVAGRIATRAGTPAVDENGIDDSGIQRGLHLVDYETYTADECLDAVLDWMDRQDPPESGERFRAGRRGSSSATTDRPDGRLHQNGPPADEPGGCGPAVPGGTRSETASSAKPGHPEGNNGTGSVPDYWRSLPADHGIDDVQRRLADEALSAGGFDSADRLQRWGYRLPARSAQRRATENGAWWNSLRDPAEQGALSASQQALIQVYPHQIGNADGLPATIRDHANRLSISRDLGEFLARKPADQRLLNWFRAGLTDAERKQFGNLVRTRNHLQELDRQAMAVPGSPPVHVLSYDSAAFNGKGKSVVALGNVDTAHTVNWHVPGTNTTSSSLAYQFKPLRNLYEETLRVDPSLELASIIWIGYDAPAGPVNTGYAKAAFRRRARIGGDRLLCAVAAFHATRNLTGTAAPDQLAIRIYGHSYGSVTMFYAGRYGRFAGLVRSAIAAGSPGAASVRHAAELGIGADNVYVAASWRDLVTMFGADEPGAWSRLNPWLGLGIDPATEAFGGKRIPAEFPDSPNFAGVEATHQGYLHRDPATGLPTEALANVAHITAGRGDTVASVDRRRAGGGVVARPIDSERGRYADGNGDRDIDSREDRPPKATPWSQHPDHPSRDR